MKNPASQTALDDTLLEETDGEDVVTHLESHVDFEYRHDTLYGGENSNQFNITWQQAFGPKHRFAGAIELPFANIGGGPEKSGGGGFGDMKVRVRGMIWKGEKFENAAEVELTLPSASTDAVGEGQTVLKLGWGFSTPLAEHTVFNGQVGYNKAVSNQRDTPGVNSIEPELVPEQGFTKRFGAYLDWDNYYEFTIHEYIQTLKVGLEFAIDRKEKCAFAPFLVFSLNHATTVVETKNAVGFNLTYAF